MESVTTTDPLSPERVEAALEWADMCPIPPYRENVNACETLAALARAHIDATKREPPVGLVEVIGTAARRYDYWTNATGTEWLIHEIVGADMVHVATAASSGEAQTYVDEAIARAVVEFATSDAAMDRVDAALGSLGDRIDDEARNIIRAALGATEEGK